MIERDPRLVIAELATRIERLEAVVVLLCQEAAHGQGSLGKPFWDFVDDWRRDHQAHNVP